MCKTEVCDCSTSHSYLCFWGEGNTFTLNQLHLPVRWKEFISPHPAYNLLHLAPCALPKATALSGRQNNVRGDVNMASLGKRDGQAHNRAKW